MKGIIERCFLSLRRSTLLRIKIDYDDLSESYQRRGTGLGLNRGEMVYLLLRNRSLRAAEEGDFSPNLESSLAQDSYFYTIFRMKRVVVCSEDEGYLFGQ